MDCMRINCAHDDAATWLRMIEHLRHAERSLGRSCRVVMDLGGPKLRTGPIEPGSAVVKIRPRRDAYGRVTAPARIWLTADTAPTEPPSAADARVPVAGEWLARLQRRDNVHLTDARGAKRTCVVVDVPPGGGCWAEADKTGLRRAGHPPALQAMRSAQSAQCPGAKRALLQVDDLLVLTRDLEPGRAASLDRGGRVLTPAMIGCTFPEVFDDAAQASRFGSTTARSAA